MALAETNQEVRASQPRIAIVDYRKGNLKSVERGLAHVGGNAFVTDDLHEIEQADAIVLPGVGAFADAAATMHALGQIPVLRERIEAGVPFLGICLGLHLLYEAGTEGFDTAGGGSDYAQGLGVLPGVVSVMPRCDSEGTCYKIPHVGWNTIAHDSSAKNPLLADIPSEEYFYFTHSYSAPDTSCTIATTTHSVTFPSVVALSETAFGVQFHPEKSSDAGAVLLRNFVTIAQLVKEGPLPAQSIPQGA